MGFLNIEIKARCRNQENVRIYLEKNHADFKGIDHQVDTYFKVPKGRLKLRQGKIENSLIHYIRTDQAGPKESRVSLYRGADLTELKDVLIQALDVLVVVDKKREIAFIGNVKFHLDIVEGLGQFVEIEAIDEDGTIGKKKLLVQCQKYLAQFGIKNEDLLEVSYSDLLLNKL